MPTFHKTHIILAQSGCVDTGGDVEQEKTHLSGPRGSYAVSHLYSNRDAWGQLENESGLSSDRQDAYVRQLIPCNLGEKCSIVKFFHLTVFIKAFYYCGRMENTAGDWCP